MGGEEGNVALVVNPITGEVNGSSYDSEIEVSVEVNNTNPLDFDTGLQFISAEDAGKVFSGMLDSSEAISGDWIETLTATAEDGTEIDGVLDLETLSLSGVWSNVNQLEAGSFTGGGCRLN